MVKGRIRLRASYNIERQKWSYIKILKRILPEARQKLETHLCFALMQTHVPNKCVLLGVSSLLPKSSLRYLCCAYTVI